MSTNRVSSILAADFGSTKTRVVLFDIVDGEYRIVAHQETLTTLGYPHDDLNVGLRNILQHLTQISGREFYNPAGRIITPEDDNGTGVDLFVTTSSAGRPIRAVIVGLVPEISIETALKAISGSYIEPIAEFHLRDGYSPDDRMNEIVMGMPDVILIAGGTDGGAMTPLVQILQDIVLGVKVLPRELRPIIIYAGNQTLQPRVSEMFAELTTVLMSDNIRPSIDKEDLDAGYITLATAYDQHRETHGEAFSVVAEMSSTGLLPTAQSYDLIAEYFAKTRQQNVIAMDMGSTSSVLVGSFGGETVTRISTTIGLGQSAASLLDEVSIEAVEKWLPFHPDKSEVRNYALNKGARPSSIPMEVRELFLEQGLIRAGANHMVSQARSSWHGVNDVGMLPAIGLIVVGGGVLTGTGNANYDMMLIADCIQPTGITDVKADRLGAIPAMGAVARTRPEAVVQLLDGSGLEHLGTLVNLEGKHNAGKVAAEIRLDVSDEPIRIMSGQLLSLPIPQDFELNIKIRCKNGFKINGKGRHNLTLKGGTGGIMIDARGRVLMPPASVNERLTTLPQWIHEATDDELIVLPADWALEPTDPRRTAVNLDELRSDNKDFDFEDDPVRQSDFNIDELLGDDDQGDIFSELEDGDPDDLDNLRGL